MAREINMRIIIGGGGRVGTGLASALRSEAKDVVLVDNNARAVKILRHGHTCSSWRHHPEREVYGGNRNCSSLCRWTNSDERNILSCALAKHVQRTTKGKATS